MSVSGGPAPATSDKPIAEGSPALAISNQLDVRDRVLVTPRTSISIANIATISLVPIIQKRPVVWPFIVALSICAAAVFSIPAPQPQRWGDQVNDPRPLFALLFLGAAMMLTIWSYSEPEPEWRLLIGASDGSLNYFASKDREMLDRARQLLTEKIDARDQSQNYHINFLSGEVQIVGQGAMVVNGSGNQIATGHGRIGTMEASNSPGAQLGNGNVSSNNTFKVDYSSMLPTVSNWRQHFEGSGYVELSKRLSELEDLMRSGTPAPESKQRVRTLTEEIIHLLGNAAEAITIFGKIARTAGF